MPNYRSKIKVVRADDGKLLGVLYDAGYRRWQKFDLYDIDHNEQSFDNRMAHLAYWLTNLLPTDNESEQAREMIDNDKETRHLIGDVVHGH